MRSPTGEPLFEAHCPICGAALVVNAKKRRRIPFARRSLWDVEEVCSGCGNQSGGTVGIVEFGSRGRVERGLEALRRCLRSIPLVNSWPDSDPDLGVADLVKLVEAAPFKVYGMNGNPLGFRLTGFGSGGKGQSMHHVSLRYSAGSIHLRSVPGERLIEIEQGTADWDYDDPEALGSIRSLVDGGVHFHRDWNLRRIERTPRDAVTVGVDGTTVVAEFASWHEPEQVTVVRMNVGGHRIRVTSLNLPEKELIHCLRTLVVLQENQGTRTQHQQDFDRASQEFQRLWKERRAC